MNIFHIISNYFKIGNNKYDLRWFFDAAFEGIAITKDGVFIDGNDRFFNMFGYSKNDMIDLPIKKFVYKDDQDLVYKNIKNNYTEPYEHRCIHKDGSMRYVEVHGHQVNYQGGIVRITAINDITNRKKNEEEIRILNFRQSQISKLEAIGSFAEGIAHDFNNALQPIIGNCELIIHDMDDRDKCKKHYKRLTNILEAAETAKLFVNRIHDFTHKDKDVKTIKSLDLTHCFQETFNFLRSMIPKSIKMEMNIDDELYFVKVEDTTIKQILMNLCKNSFQAMPDKKGMISINVNNKEFELEEYGIPKGKYVRIKIKDDGIGMTPEVMKRAFDPYFTTKKKEDGVGIGLSVVNKIILEYSGYMHLYSEVNKGTKVSIYIPIIE
jgi:PAS domain S-box-containing protein